MNEEKKLRDYNLKITSGLSKKLVKGQDVALVNSELLLFGVFDGIGKDENSLEAALLASETIHSSVEKNEDKSVQNSPNMLVNALNEAHKEIVIESTFRSVGSTTASIAKLTRNDEKIYLAWASVGDSRIYLRDANGSLTALSHDESSGIYVDNCLGNEKHFHGISQEGLVELFDKGEIVIVSDGVVGSSEEDSMGIEEINNILIESKTAQEAADRLTNNAKKIDDKTAIVIRIKS
ncbi:MAG: PP2C family protein-serine/threonine phosphatase [bacterium]